MKKILLVLFLAIASHSYAQLLLNEDFTGLTVGNLDGQSGWLFAGSGAVHATVANTTPLTYTGYNGGGGEYMNFASNNATTSRAYKSFATSVSAITPGTTVYYSLLMNLSATVAASNAYFFSLTDTGSVGNYFAKIYAKNLSATTYQLGIAKTSTSVISWDTTARTIGQTYLIVVRYDIHNTAITQTGNEVFMWVNPSLSSVPSTAACQGSQLAAAAQGDFSTVRVGGVSWFNRGITNPFGSIDGIRVAAGTDSVSAWTTLAAAKPSSGIAVTFRSNLAVQMKKGAFTPGTDSLVIRGNFQVDAGDVGDWQGYKFKLMPATAGDSIYTITLNFPASLVGKGYQYKFVKNDTWESNYPSRSEEHTSELQSQR